LARSRQGSWRRAGRHGRLLVSLIPPMPIAAEDLAGYVVEAGAVVGGGAALGGGGAFIVALVAWDLGFRVNVTRWVERGGGYGGVFGMVALLFRALGID
jgi:hypothetical protein